MADLSVDDDFGQTAADAVEMAKAMVARIQSGWVAEDMPVIEAMHPDALLVVPLYRSALVVLPPPEHLATRGAVRLLLYHDPAWMGQATTEENMRHHRWEALVVGQRSGPDVYWRQGCRDGHSDFAPMPATEAAW